MDITGIHEDHSMLGGKVLFELELEPGETDVLDANYLGYAFTEPYDGNHLWFWAQVGLPDAIDDIAFWDSVSYGISSHNGGQAPSGPQLQEMVRQRIAIGNEPDFEQRLG